MIRLLGFGFVLATSVIPTARAADVLGEAGYRTAPFILVPDCTQNAPPIGLACVPRGDLGTPDPRAVRAAVDLNRTSQRLPYRQLFNWGP